MNSCDLRADPLTPPFPLRGSAVPAALSSVHLSSSSSWFHRDDGQDNEEAELETQNGPAPPPHTFCLTSHLLLTWTQETDTLDEL